MKKEEKKKKKKKNQPKKYQGTKKIKNKGQKDKIKRYHQTIRQNVQKKSLIL